MVPERTRTRFPAPAPAGAAGPELWRTGRRRPAAGLARLAWGSKGWAFYVDNPLFWVKLGLFGLFGLIGLLSITPTLRILGWRREGRVPDAAAQRTVRRWMGAQLLLIPALLLLAPLMARGVGHWA